MKMMEMLVTTSLIAMMLVMITMMTSSKIKKGMEKKYEFECGFNSMSNNRMPFSSQFFMVTIMFLIFDLEISMVMPASTEQSKNMSLITVMLMMMVVMTLAMVVEWKMGSLEWSK